jgi:hypothetical protein
MPADLHDGPDVFQNAAQRATSIGDGWQDARHILPSGFGRIDPRD